MYYAAEALSAIHSDAVVRVHYTGLKADRLRLIASSGRPMYSSYRKQDRVYWTTKRVRVPEGEAVLTDGSQVVRARCGNRLSKTPQQQVEPAVASSVAEEELDRTVARPMQAAEVVAPSPLDPPRSGYANDAFQPDGTYSTEGLTASFPQPGAVGKAPRFLYLQRTASVLLRTMLPAQTEHFR